MRYAQYDTSGNIIKTGICSMQKLIKRIAEGKRYVMLGHTGKYRGLDLTHKVNTTTKQLEEKD